MLFFMPVLSHGLEYAVGDGDLLKITVYNNPDLTSEVRVSGEGKISVPLIGEVFVNAMTATEIGKKLAGLFSDGYIKNPQVAVFIQEYKSKKVTTLGEFTKPGLIEMRGNSTLMEVISNAGGITANAGETLFIQRNAVKKVGASQNVGQKDGQKEDPKEDQKEDTIISIDLVRLLEGTDMAANVPVLDGDSIYVPKAAFVYVTGEVKTPGAYKITKGLTVLRSITLAGGFTFKANENKTEIVRKIGNTEKSIRVKMEDLVMPDDIIVVPESFF